MFTTVVYRWQVGAKGFYVSVMRHHVSVKCEYPTCMLAGVFFETEVRDTTST